MLANAGHFYRLLRNIITILDLGKMMPSNWIKSSRAESKQKGNIRLSKSLIANVSSRKAAGLYALFLVVCNCLGNRHTKSTLKRNLAILSGWRLRNSPEGCSKIRLSFFVGEKTFHRTWSFTRQTIRRWQRRRTFNLLDCDQRMFLVCLVLPANERNEKHPIYKSFNKNCLCSQNFLKLPQVI